jgi:hypothetical protein
VDIAEPRERTQPQQLATGAAIDCDGASLLDVDLGALASSFGSAT